jgi:hypothetical protein
MQSPNHRIVSIIDFNPFSDINCRDCGSHFSPCIASGQSILAKEYYTCKTCKHKALESELNYLKLKHCPLCHGKINVGEPASNAAGSGIIAGGANFAPSSGASAKKPGMTRQM